MPVIWKYVAMVSRGAGVITKPEVVCVFSCVVAPVTDGPARMTLITAAAGGPLNPLTELVVDCSTVKPPATNAEEVGVNLRPTAP